MAAHACPPVAAAPSPGSELRYKCHLLKRAPVILRPRASAERPGPLHANGAGPPRGYRGCAENPVGEGILADAAKYGPPCASSGSSRLRRATSSSARDSSSRARSAVR
ncbi:MAG: hypothetical protein RL385_1781 [Pseudomonadota bacterium]